MSGDLGSGAGDGRARREGRPDFLPPEEGGLPPEPIAGQPPEPAPAEPPAGPPDEPPARHEPSEPRSFGAFWNALTLAAAAALLVSAFLPWVRAEIVFDAFGEPLSHDAGSAAGIDADGTILVVPVLALVAAAMTFWGMAARDRRIAVLTAVPGTLALLVCGLFVLRLDSARDELTGGGRMLGYEITFAYGWYLAVAAALLVVGFALARPVAARLTRRGGPGGAGRNGPSRNSVNQNPGDAAAWGRAASP
ncbi:hypothetical protein [Actinomadura hibisca]|uniref:hypothetical protein n=1 Tax=Actinomadura hibisca TaxID=68565 RepID=UPI000833311E|nr:hypothetical protein [Actinomadura hibisca]